MVVGLFSLLPFAYLVLAGFSLAAIRQQFAYPTTIPVIARTVALTTAISALSLLLGVATATLVVRTDIPGRSLFTILFTMPLAIPGFVSSYAAYAASLTYVPQSSFVTSFAGASLIMSLTLYPYVFLPCVVALRSLDRAQEQVARTLRRRSFSPFLRVTLPQLRPALAAGVLIVSLHVLAEYGAMVQLGQQTLTTTIMSEIFNYGDYGSARSLSMLLAALSLAVLLANRWFSGRFYPVTLGAGVASPPTRWRLRRLRPVVMLASLVIPLAAVAPTVLMTARGLLESHREGAGQWSQALAAVGSTLGYAASAALLGSVVALPVSWWVAKRPSFPATLTERSVWIAHSIPNAILALALVFLSTRLVPGLYKTPTLLVLAYVILFLPLAVSNQRVGLQAALTSFDEIASSLGSRPLRTFFRVSLPLALPGILTGALLVGLDASKELTTTLMLLPFNSHTLATGLWATTNGESLDFVAAAPYALLMVLLGSIPALLILRRTLRGIA